MRAVVILTVDSTSPEGREPDANEIVYGALPPDAIKSVLYFTPIVAIVALEMFVWVRKPIWIVNDFVTGVAGVDESTSVTVTLYLPFLVGVPEIRPARLRVRPGGTASLSDAGAQDQIYGLFPPVAIRGWE
jgi:hypothetical protein